jgi:hypothetical protein
MQYSREFLSESALGSPLFATALSTLLHQATTTVGAFDEVYLWASNFSATAKKLTIDWNGTGGFLCVDVEIPGNSPPIPIATGQVMNSGNILATTPDGDTSLSIVGYVNRITP